jgi:Down syndrome cell adhesion molecule
VTSGSPQDNIWWMKNGKRLEIGSRIRSISENQIRITVSKEDQGMYQCFVSNENDVAQSSSQVYLDEIEPQLHYRFIDQTLQPGPSVSLKCSASGNPTPQIAWLLDGFQLSTKNERILIGQYVTISGMNNAQREKTTHGEKNNFHFNSYLGEVISHVNITAVKNEDGGEYECIAQSRAGQASHSARLNIYGLPYIRPMPPISTIAGKTLTIKCPSAGYPIDKIIWEKSK